MSAFFERYRGNDYGIPAPGVPIGREKRLMPWETEAEVERLLVSIPGTGFESIVLTTKEPCFLKQ